MAPPRLGLQTTRYTNRSLKGDRADIEIRAQLRREKGVALLHILFATPTAGGVVKAGFAVTLFRAAIAVKEAGWGADLVTIDSSYVASARNYFANVLVRQLQFTHLVMIDSDMSFKGDIICRLLRSGKPFVAGTYPKRRMDLAIFAQAARDSELGIDQLAAVSLEYNITLEPGIRELKILDGMCRVDRIGLGCAVIRREALVSLIDSGIVGLRPDGFLQGLGMEGPYYDFFSEIRLDDGDRLSEDYSFCERWRSKPGNEIWALVDEPIGHVGEMIYDAPFLNRFRQVKPDV